MFTTYIVTPIYNAFVFLIGVMPGGDVGLAIIALTVLTRIVLYPVFTSSIRSQMAMQAMQTELEAAKPKLKDNKEELGKLQLELARKYKVNPLSLLGSLVVQIAVPIALYIAMFREGFPTISQSLLYSFVHTPTTVATHFLGLVDLLTSHHLVIAALAALSQYFAIRLTVARTSSSQGSVTQEKASQMRMQNGVMLYALPLLMACLGYFFQAAIGLYLITTGLFSVFQEILIRRGMS